MQGAFPQGADWDSVLDPGLDDEAQEIKRSDRIHDELERLATARGIPPAPKTQAQILLEYTHVWPPTPQFYLKEKRFFVLDNSKKLFFRENGQIQASAGQYGHYLVTIANVDGFRRNYPQLYEVRPLKRTTQLPAHEQENPLPSGYPGQHDNRHTPSPLFCRSGIDYICKTEPATYYEIGLDVLKQCLEKAEGLDLAFARRMEGLGNAAPQVYWDCLDPDYDPSDRPAVMEQFMASYLKRFYDGIDPETGPATALVSDEALHKHKTFCQAWAKKHYKTLTPAVTAPAEALVSEFYPYITSWFPPEKTSPTRAELARLLMRHDDTAAQFASSLHFYINSLEQARGGRNASYKQMTTVSMYRASSHKSLGDLLGEKATVLRNTLATISNTPHERFFNHLIVDWHTILGQMPHTHRLFQNDSVVQGLLKRARRDQAQGAHVPPWRNLRG
jgi:hypothetical protein